MPLFSHCIQADLVSELEICLELQTSSSRTVSEELPLPLSTYEEEGMYYFLAMATHRKLLVEVMDTIGFKCKLHLTFCHYAQHTNIKYTQLGQPTTCL